MHSTSHCRLQHCKITAVGLAALLARVRASPSRLEELMCVYCLALGLLATFYSRDYMLTRSLNHNPLGDEGAAVLADWLATSPPLQTLV